MKQSQIKALRAAYAILDYSISAPEKINKKLISEARETLIESFGAELSKPSFLVSVNYADGRKSFVRTIYADGAFEAEKILRADYAGEFDADFSEMITKPRS